MGTHMALDFGVGGVEQPLLVQTVRAHELAMCTHLQTWQYSSALPGVSHNISALAAFAPLAKPANNTGKAPPPSHHSLRMSAGSTLQQSFPLKNR